MERQRCSKEGTLQTKWAQKDESNKGTATLSLIKEGMRYSDSRQQGPKKDEMVSQKEKHNTQYFCNDILLFIFCLSSGVAVT